MQRKRVLERVCQHSNLTDKDRRRKKEEFVYDVQHKGDSYIYIYM